MSLERPDKKSDTIKFRVPWSLKRDFMHRARQEGRPASDIFRDLMEDYLRRPAQRTTAQTLGTAMTTIRRHPRQTGFAAVLGAAGISALVAGALPAGAAPNLRAHFERLDINGDGFLSRAELAPQGLDLVRVADFILKDGEAQRGALAGPSTPSQRRELPSLEPLTTVGPLLLPVPSSDRQQRVMLIQLMHSGGDVRRDITLVSSEAIVTEFQDGDANADGTMTFDEFQSHYLSIRRSSFDILDTDRDGQISAAEIMDNPIDRPDSDAAAGALRLADANGDGRITRAEYEDAV